MLEASAQRLLRELAPQVVGIVTRRCGNFAAAEDAVQEALIAAAAQWPEEMPSNPRGWLIRVALRRLTDHVRSEVARRNREDLVVSLIAPEDQIAVANAAQDDTLELLFMCCHPSLSTASSVALTLRAVGGLTTSEIAKAFLVPEATMAQRISRAKQTIDASDLPLERPEAAELAPRTAAVMHVLYLIFNEGYTASAGDALVRTDLAAEAIRLARHLHRTLPDDPEVAGLLALMLLTDARREARTGPDGQLVPLDEQDRTRWDRAAITEGTALVTAAFARGMVGLYQLQAAIAACHDEAATVEDTDWAEIQALYGVLQQLDRSPMVRLNHAIATAMVSGPAAGLAEIETFAADPHLREHHRLFAVRAHLLERTGDIGAAIAHYEDAAPARRAPRNVTTCACAPRSSAGRVRHGPHHDRSYRRHRHALARPR